MSSDSNNSGFNRRQFLGGGLLFGFSGLAASPLEMLVKILTDDLISKAQAQEAGVVPTRNYVNLLLPGAPNRYVFDQWLQTDPNSTLKVLANPMNTTALLAANGNAVNTQYSTFNYKGLLVPTMFSHNVIGGNGQQRPLSDLLDNMMVIRGYGSGVDGHTNNAVMQMGPLGGTSSISGVAADYSAKTFQALQYPARKEWGNYSSSTGKALNVVGTNLPLNDLMAGFGAPGAKTASLLLRQQNAIDIAQARLQAYVKSDFTGSATLAKNMTNATALMKKGISDLDGFWSEATARYTKAFQDSARMTGLPGLSDMTLVPNPADPKWNVHISEGDRAVMPNGDLTSIITNFKPPAYLIEGFALAEYVLTQGLVTSLELMIPTDDPGKIILADGIHGSDSSTTFSYHNDMHNMGAIATVITTSILFRGISAVILELADKLKTTKLQNSSADLWSQTVLQITSDFGRSGRTDGTGADHGINQMITSVYSGIIKSPLVIGNIYQTNHNSSGYGGTQGVGAPIDDYYKSSMPTPVMMASTVANLLGAPTNPYANIAPPLASVQNGQVIALAKGKMVEG